MSTKRKTAHEAALDVLLPAQANRDEHNVRVQVLLAWNSLLSALEEEREQAGFSKKDIAEQASLDYASIRRLLNSDEGNPTFDTIIRLLGTMNLGLEIVNEKGERRPIVGTRQ